MNKTQTKLLSSAHTAATEAKDQLDDVELFLAEQARDDDQKLHKYEYTVDFVNAQIETILEKTYSNYEWSRLVSKRVDNLLAGLRRRLRGIERVVQEMEGNVDILKKEAEPEAYRRWYPSYQGVRSLEGLVTDSLERLDAYYAYMKLPWWKRMFKRSF